ncbi:helix-turn-helix domain-containing protein [Larkinella sp. VNQ87]|uniref:helix-turn-helix domain-containing protein n=1 Tax=Larkinella sp. VNQ87 TaxID=3400921 RepID=UPI003C0D6D35
MKKNPDGLVRIRSLTDQHRMMGVSKPVNPLVSVLKFEEVGPIRTEETVKMTSDFYAVALKKHCDCKIKYGQTYYDFDEGVMSFAAPHQVFTWEAGSTMASAGWLLTFHADFIRNSPLGSKIREYGFFDYAINEALILSEEEETALENLYQTLDRETRLPIDAFSQEIIVSQIDLLLKYCNRFYTRQFITRRVVHHDLLARFDAILTEYVNSDQLPESGPPTVAHLADRLNLSPKYLSDLLRNLTGQSTQQHIHEKLIEKAKQILTTTNLSVSEIAYRLGFEYPQSFNKLFRNKTELSPLEFRQSFN